jgi:hypothetical protein
MDYVVLTRHLCSLYFTFFLSFVSIQQALNQRPSRLLLIIIIIIINPYHHDHHDHHYDDCYYLRFQCLLLSAIAVAMGECDYLI